MELFDPDDEIIAACTYSNDETAEHRAHFTLIPGYKSAKYSKARWFRVFFLGGHVYYDFDAFHDDRDLVPDDPNNLLTTYRTDIDISDPKTCSLKRNNRERLFLDTKRRRKPLVSKKIKGKSA